MLKRRRKPEDMTVAELLKFIGSKALEGCSPDTICELCDLALDKYDEEIENWSYELRDA